MPSADFLFGFHRNVISYLKQTITHGNWFFTSLVALPKAKKNVNVTNIMGLVFANYTKSYSLHAKLNILRRLTCTTYKILEENCNVLCRAGFCLISV